MREWVFVHTETRTRTEPTVLLRGETLHRGVPLRGEQTSEDIDKLLVFRSNESAQNITLNAISIDGGTTLQLGQRR